MDWLIIRVAVAEPLIRNSYPFHFPSSFFYYSSNINLQVKLSLIQAIAQENFVQKTYLLQNFLNQYAKQNNTFKAQVKQKRLQEFHKLLKYKIIKSRFQVSNDLNHFIQKDSIQLKDIRSYKVICFYEIINRV